MREAPVVPRWALQAALVLLLLGVTSLSKAGAQTPRQIAARTFPSVVLLTVEGRDGEARSLGSGFFVGEDLIATNLHVIAGASRAQAKIIGKAATYEVSGVVALDESADLCVLKIAGVKAARLPLGDDGQMGVGDTVYAVGNPRGLEGTFSEGIISAFRGPASDRLIQITAAISPGSSGGPVLDARGNVIGVAVATVREGQNLNFAVPVSSLKKMLGNLGPIAKLPLASRSTYSADGQWVLLSRNVQMPPGAVLYNPSSSAWSSWEPAEGHGAYQTQVECLKAAESGQKEMARQLPRFLFQFTCVRNPPGPDGSAVLTRPGQGSRQPDCQILRNPDGTVQVYRTVHPDGGVTYTNCPPDAVDPRGPKGK